MQGPLTDNRPPLCLFSMRVLYAFELFETHSLRVQFMPKTVDRRIGECVRLVSNGYHPLNTINAFGDQSRLTESPMLHQ